MERMIEWVALISWLCVLFVRHPSLVLLSSEGMGYFVRWEFGVPTLRERAVQGDPPKRSEVAWHCCQLI